MQQNPSKRPLNPSPAMKNNTPDVTGKNSGAHSIQVQTQSQPPLVCNNNNKPRLVKRGDRKFLISFKGNSKVDNRGMDESSKKSIIEEIERDAQKKLVEVKKEILEDVIGSGSDKYGGGIGLKRKLDESFGSDTRKRQDVRLTIDVGNVEKKGRGLKHGFFMQEKPKRRTTKLIEVEHSQVAAMNQKRRGGQLQTKSQNFIPASKNAPKAGVTRYKVKLTLRLYQALVRKLLQGQESKPKQLQINYRSNRADLLAAKILKDNNRWVNTGKQILGEVPGVEVGDEFHFRAELAIVGLHHPFQVGIDHVKRNGKILATSVVTSWHYANDSDNYDVLIYSGQGGNPTDGNEKAEDQKMEKGNLALKNSIDEQTPVRVIRGIKDLKVAKTQARGGPGSMRERVNSLSTRGKLVTTYTYDGLYLVESYWQEKSSHGTDVFKFQLRRMPKQPELAIKELNLMKTQARGGLRIEDISEGKEKIPVSAVNTINDENPPKFQYRTTMIYPPWYKPSSPRGCKCKDNCGDPLKCECAGKNGGEIPFNHNGAIVEVKPLVYECGPSCGCPPSCYNRVSQHGIKFQLEIFKTESRGWGVRSLDSISSGSFICEYTGELLEDMEAEKRINNDEYLFDIGHNYNDLWEGLSKLIPPDLRSSHSSDTVEDAGDVAFTIDGAHCGNVCRFINHSCSPNLYAQNVLYDHDDKRVPHIMLFAAQNISPLEELTYHYNYQLDQVLDSEGNIKKKDCYCGSDECIGRMY